MSFGEDLMLYGGVESQLAESAFGTAVRAPVVKRRRGSEDDALPS